MLAIAKDYSQEPVAADDADSAMWIDVQALNPEGASCGACFCSDPSSTQAMQATLTLDISACISAVLSERGSVWALCNAQVSRHLM